MRSQSKYWCRVDETQHSKQPLVARYVVSSTRVQQSCMDRLAWASKGSRGLPSTGSHGG